MSACLFNREFHSLGTKDEERWNSFQNLKLFRLSLEEVFYIFEDDFGIVKSEALRAEKDQQRRQHEEYIEVESEAHEV